MLSPFESFKPYSLLQAKQKELLFSPLSYAIDWLTGRLKDMPEASLTL
jgi:hypothetical protein